MIETIAEKIQRTRETFEKAGWENIGENVYVPGPELRKKQGQNASREELLRTLRPSYMAQEER